MLIWVIGMSGAGKTSIGESMLNIMQAQEPEGKWILLDGDTVRSRFNHQYGYDLEGRRINNQNMVKLCEEQLNKGHNVIACILSIFPEQQIENRIKFKNYKQVFIKVSIEKLKQRDNKRIYSKAENNLMDNVVGVQIPFPEPVNSDYVLCNDTDNVRSFDLARETLKGLGILKEIDYRYTKIDLLDKPTKYEYTEYVGREFLASFKKNRDYFLANSHQDKVVIEKVNSGKTKFYSKYSYVKDSWIFNFDRELDKEGGCSNTRKKLVSILKDLNHKRHHIIQDEIILKLIGRFEVSKKIFDNYDWESLKRKSSESRDLFNYPLLSIILSFYILELQNLNLNIYKNAQLKINDIIISSNKFTKSKVLNHASCIAIALEKNTFEEELDELLS